MEKALVDLPLRFILVAASVKRSQVMPRKVSKKPRRSRAKNKRNKSTLSYA
jgi:hypothetical protein